MKCLILAGGSGDRLWPLSRKNYPKQFMAINENRSLLQETVVRNLPLCDEFLIVTNESYNFIVDGQLNAFQEVRYRSFLEQMGRKTAAAIALVCMLANPSELFCVVSADTLIEGKGYQEAVLRARQLAQQGQLVVFGIPITSAHTGYGYVQCHGEQVLSFKEKPDYETAKQYMESGEYLWNSGMFVFCAGDLLHELRTYSPEIYRACKTCVKKADISGRTILFTKEMMEEIPAMSIETAVFEHSKHVSVVRGEFEWQDIGRLEDLEDAPIHRNSGHVIQYESENVTVINNSYKQLVVTNELKDAMVVHTDDVTYIGKKGASNELKRLMRAHEEYAPYYENNRLTYRPYGSRQVLFEAPNYRVKKVVLYPGCKLGYHKHDYRSEHWSIVEGNVFITLGDETAEYFENQSIFVPVGVGHCVENRTDKNVTIIEVAVGSAEAGKPFTEDLIPMEHERSEMGREGIVTEPIVRLMPAFKDYLWGGTRLKTVFGKKTDLACVAESWELSAHPDGQSIVAEGKQKGKLFGEYLKAIGKAAWGWKCQSLQEFPILIKFLDARENLSVQVHPDDDYALVHEHEYGKNEMWHVLDAEEGAYVYMGFEKPLIAEEVQQHVKAGTLESVLRKIPVKKHDTIFIPAGCVHAIGAGVFVCEVQQNSNSTYRLYDYNRLDKYGRPRELHMEKAKDVMQIEAQGVLVGADEMAEDKTVLGICKYFRSVRYELEGEIELQMDTASFMSILIVEGAGTICVGDRETKFCGGDSFFLPAAEQQVFVRGRGACLVTQV